MAAAITHKVSKASKLKPHGDSHHGGNTWKRSVWLADQMPSAVCPCTSNV